MPVRNLFNVVGRVLQGVRSVVLGAPKTQPADDASPLPALSATPACPLPASGGDAPKKRVSTDDVPDEDRVSSCMSKPVVSLDAEKTVAQAQTLMAKHNVSSILVRAGRSRDKGRAGACQRRVMTARETSTMGNQNERSAPTRMYARRAQGEGAERQFPQPKQTSTNLPHPPPKLSFAPPTPLTPVL